MSPYLLFVDIDVPYPSASGESRNAACKIADFGTVTQMTVFLGTTPVVDGLVGALADMLVLIIVLIIVCKFALSFSTLG